MNFYKITLREEERETLEEIGRRRENTSHLFIVSRVLLLCEEGERGKPAYTVSPIAEVQGISERTIEHIKERFVEHGLESVLWRKSYPQNRPRKFDGAFAARVTQLACSAAPAGRARWTMQLLAEKAVELKITDKVSPMTICRTLKKTNYNPIAASNGRFRQKRTVSLSPAWKT
jgi:transposase